MFVFSSIIFKALCIFFVPCRSTTTVATLPPPGGDIPPYMSFVNEAKAQYEATKKSNEKPLIEPPILKKIPMPISQSPPKLPPQSIPKHKV